MQAVAAGKGQSFYDRGLTIAPDFKPLLNCSGIEKFARCGAPKTKSFPVDKPPGRSNVDAGIEPGMEIDPVRFDGDAEQLVDDVEEAEAQEQQEQAEAAAEMSEGAGDAPAEGEEGAQ